MPIFDITFKMPLSIALMKRSWTSSSEGAPGNERRRQESVSSARYGLIASAP